MIRSLIFDIGNVLADFNWRDYLDGFSLSKEEDQAVTEALFLSPKWKEVDRGRLPDEELLASICEDAPGYVEQVRRVYAEAAAAVEQNSYAAGLLKGLKEQGYRIYILSNYGKTFFEERLSRFEFLQYADGQVISYQVQSVKPEPEIYEALISRYQICPEEAVFFDDLPQNLETARQFGLHTVLVTGYESIVEGLKKFDIEI
ncbi:HAD family hydrolase [Qiania dongpingensis]|uniref:HAD family phosphatase n=1 Tax=Qiania dongpingensis TaxID=2763669 RepID=A0A7G9G7H7_9FIRM|nr:HAD family phosphatase [Qiania dongpingensis]QNM06759.1 HAD family phosphatase [Qiania dongpingensis]